MRKDGKPDARTKEGKRLLAEQEAEKKKAAEKFEEVLKKPSAPLKADGTPDMRYKVNKQAPSG